MIGKNKLVLTFDYYFTDEVEVFFAFSYPYEYQKNELFVNKLSKDYSLSPDIYFHKEILVLSPQNRNVHLLTISSK